MPLGNPIRKQNESRMVSVLATEGQTVFTVQGGYIINHISVFRNGVRLSPAEDFTAGDGSTVTLNNAANIDDRIDFHIFDRFTVQNAIIGAASTQTINGDLVLNGKLFGQLDVPSINLTGIVTATELDLNGKGDISGDLNVVGVTTVGKQVHVGTGVSIAAGGLNVTAGISTFQAVQGTTGTFSGAVSGTTGTFTGDVSIPDKIVHTGDTHTAIRFTGNDTITLDTGGTSRVQITDATTDIGNDLSIADKIIHTGDTNTAIRFPSADAITAETAGSERIRIDSTGRVLIGDTTPRSHDGGNNALLQLSDNVSGRWARIASTTYINSTIGGGIILAHSRNGTVGSHTIVQDDDKLGSVFFEGSDGSAFQRGAQIQAYVDGTPGSDDMPGRIEFSTTADGASSPTERLRIDSSGRVLIGTTTEGRVTADNLTVASSGHTGITIRSGTSSGGNISFSDGTSGDDENRGLVSYDHASNFMRFYTNAAERLRIDSSGHLLHGVTSDEDTSGNGGLRFINTGDIQIDGDQKALVFRSTNSTAQIQSGIEWWNENGAGVQAKILCDRTAVTKAPSDLVFYTNTDVDTSANNSEGNITEQLRIKSDGNSAFTGSITAQNYASRNLIINGDCSVCQYRGITGETTGVGVLTTDRWRLEYAGHDEEITQEHRNNPVTDAPSKLGISHSFQVKNGNQTSTGSSDYARITHTIESQYMRNSGWDFKNPNSYVTLSFWCKSTVSKNFYGQFFCQDSPFMQRSFETGTLSANTWTKVEVTIPGDSNINFDHNVGPGLIITWYLYAPTSYTSGNGALNTWMGNNATKRVPADSDAWWTADNATFDITGVQLEVGSTATNFELKNYDQNLWECKRYYQRSTDQNRGSNYSLQSSTWHSADGVQRFNKHNNYYDFKQNFEREMRVVPTLTIYGSSNQGDIHLESVAVGSKQVDWNNNTTEVQTKGFLLRHIEDQSDGNYTSGSGNAFGILAYTLDAEF